MVCFDKLTTEQLEDWPTYLKASTSDASSAVRDSMATLIAAIDRKLSSQIRLILHHPDFQQLEGTWRGLYYLVTHTETDEMLKIKLLNLSKSELRQTLKRYSGSAKSQNPLLIQLDNEAYRHPGGEPFGSLIGDYYFAHHSQDVEILDALAEICAIAHTPFLAGGAPALLGLASWREMDCLNDDDLVRLFSTAEFEPWRNLRRTENARFLYLTIPRFLARPPYGASTWPVTAFDFEEEDRSPVPDPQDYLWANAAYAMAANISRAFKVYGWGAHIRGIESGGCVEDLPEHVFPNEDGGVDQPCSLEAAFSDRREDRLSRSIGLAPLIHVRRVDSPVFLGALSIRQPTKAGDPDRIAQDHFSARLPYLLIIMRFSQYLRCIVRDHSTVYRNRLQMQQHLQRWLQQYVCADPDHASESEMARNPLAEAIILVEEIKNDSMHYRAKFFIRPLYQLEGLSVTFHLAFWLPAVAGVHETR